jgi:signal transduction histidine kinase
MGIASADLPHIFEPFYRSSSVAAAQIHGTGLGLPLAKSIAEAMNGDLTVRSTPGEGSTFTLHLPVAEPSAESREMRATPAVVQH